MKSIKIVFVFALLNTVYLLASAQNPVISKGKDHITFKVNEVEYSKTAFEKVPYREALEHRVGSAIEGMPLQYKKDFLIPVDVNAFMAAVHLSYAKHYPLIISPDMIWMLICQGASAHINAHSDSLRPMLVNHTGKVKLQFSRPKFKKGNFNNNWESVFSEISDSMKGYLKADVYNQFIHSFSTTGPVEKSAFEIAFLESMKSYFEIDLNIACGIPEITLEGTPDDWKWIRENTAFLNQFGLEDWVNAMNPVLDQFVKASEGAIDPVFWKSFYFWESGCGTRINGWVCVFFPYNNEGVYQKKMMQAEPDKRSLAPFSLPSGISKVPFNMISYSDTFKMEFVSGFIGVRQNEIHLAVRPEISYAIREQPPTNNTYASDSEENKVTKIDYHALDKLFNTILDTLNPDGILTSILNDFALDARYFNGKPTTNDYSELSNYDVQPPLAFLDSGLNLIENIDSLSSYVNKRLDGKISNKEVEISFFISRFGTISDLYVIHNDDPDYKEIMSILKGIRVVSPATINGFPIYTIIYTTLMIK